MKKALLLIVVESNKDITADDYQKFLERSFWGTTSFTESSAKFDVIDLEEPGDIDMGASMTRLGIAKGISSE